ncbi:MAG: DUF6152 family protein [Gammaproteobacteria bacterium]
MSGTIRQYSVGGRAFYARSLSMLAALLLAALAARPVFAHHSFAAVFDPESLVTVTGTATRLELSNPHAYLHVEVTGDDGEIENWLIEMPGKLSLARRGWTDDTITQGATVTAIGHPARDGSTRMGWQRIQLSDGTELLFPALADQLAIEEQRRERARRARGQ